MVKFSPQRKATIISSTTAFFLMTTKFIVWVFSGSMAVLSSAIDSMMDLFVSVFNNFALYVAEKNPDRDFNYWRWKIEALASMFEWLIIIVSWLYIFVVSILKILNKTAVEHIWVSVGVMIFSVVVTLFLVLYLNSVSRKTKNLVIESDALHYKTDLLSNSWILIWLVIIKFSWLYIIDSFIWILIAIFIIKEALILVKKWVLLLLDVSLEKEEVEKIEKILQKYKEVESFHDLKTRQSWVNKFVEVDLVFDECMRLIDIHNIVEDIEKEIHELDSNSVWDVTIHADPKDDSGEDDCWCEKNK